MKPNKSVGIIIAIALAVVAASVMAYLIFTKAGQFKDLAVATIKDQSDIIRYESELSELKDLSRQEGSLKSYVEATERLMPGKPDEGGLMDYLRNMASGTSSAITQINFADRVKADGFIIMPMTMSFEGEYKDLEVILEKIRTGTRAVRIDGINIVKAEDVGNRIKAELTANAFCLGE